MGNFLFPKPPYPYSDRGGGRADSARTGFGLLQLFLISELVPLNLVTFLEIYLGTIWESKPLSIQFDVTMATTFYRVFFQNFVFFTYFMKKCNFFKVRFTVLDHFGVLSSFLITFNFGQFWRFSKVCGKIKKSKMTDPRWPPFNNMTESSNVIRRHQLMFRT